MGNSKSSIKTSEKGVWSWKSNKDPWKSNEPEEWMRYTDIENEIIEKAYYKGVEIIELDYYKLDLKRKVQMRKTDASRQRPIKRVIFKEELIREERFSLPVLPTKSLSDRFTGFQFMNKYLDKFHFQIGIFIDDSTMESFLKILETVVKDAAKGIISEGKSLGKNKEAEHLAKQLKNVQSSTYEEIAKVCIILYTKECYLYKSVNKALREDDFSKSNTLGPFCVLLNIYLQLNTTSHQQHHSKPRDPHPLFCEHIQVYRGVHLTEEMIQEYKNPSKSSRYIGGAYFLWKAFVSTTRNRKKAESFGNALFIIELINYRCSLGGLDISSFSDFPNEEEVLLPASNHYCLVDGYNELKEENGKYIIHLRTASMPP